MSQVKLVHPRACRGRVVEHPLLGLVGCTPAAVLRLGPARLVVKLEYMNPTGSHKDRIALYMILDALERGKVSPGDYVVEASSGNTAVSVAWVARQVGLKPVIVVPRGTSSVKIALLYALGAEVRFVEAANMDEMVEEAKRIADEIGGYYLNQFANPANPLAHYETTGPELLEQAGGEIDYFVMGVGTGGTITGVGRFLREKLGNRVRVVAVVPRGSPITGGPGGKHADRIEGLASDYKKPANLDMSVVDEIVEVTAADAERGMLELARYGILAGHSTGAAFHVAKRIAAKESGVTIAIIAADSLQRYPDIVLRALEREKITAP